jgi:DNA repair exonuclease SbcCD ATPase subunit
LQSFREQLDRFADLDQHILAERDRRSVSEKDHRTYIENYPVAKMLEARESELKVIEEELSNYATSFSDLKQSLEQARSVYNEDRHISIRRELEESIDKAATLASELNASTTRLAEINQEIERLFIAKHRLQELSAQREKYNQLFGLSDFIRDVLKKAVPFITEAHLQSISIEANQLYREITGNPMTSLRWDAGYEITLEEDGHERPFANMSGGEQMAAALAVRLALLKELSDIRLAFFDEPTTNMDEDRRRNLAQQIGRIKDFDQLFVISHDDTFEGFTDRVVHVHPPAERTAE